eukprot:768429-Hanusia_phi.AAC.20
MDESTEDDWQILKQRANVLRECGSDSISVEEESQDNMLDESSQSVHETSQIQAKLTFPFTPIRLKEGHSTETTMTPEGLVLRYRTSRNPSIKDLGTFAVSEITIMKNSNELRYAIPSIEMHMTANSERIGNNK